MLRAVRNFYFAPDTGANGGAGEGNGGNNTAGTGNPASGGESLADIMNGGTGGGEPNTQTDTKGNEGKGEADKGAEHPAWMQQLTEDMRSDGELSKFKSLKELANAYKELAAKGADGSVKLPGADAKPEEVQAFYKALGKPDTADGYDIKSGEKGADTSAFKKLAFDANLTGEQAQAVYAALEAQGKAAVEAREAGLKRQYQETDAALRKEFGAAYGEKMELLKRGVNAFGGGEVTKKLSAAGLLFDGDIVRMFLRLGEMNAEGATASRASSGSGYKSVAEGGRIAFEHLDQLK